MGKIRRNSLVVIGLLSADTNRLASVYLYRLYFGQTVFE